MKLLVSLSFCILALGACCDKIYMPYLDSSIQLKLDYHHDGFEKADTIFKLTYIRVNNNSNYDTAISTTVFSSPFYNDNKLDSTLNIRVNYNNYKVIIESMVSNFKDSLTNIGYSTKEVQRNRGRCKSYEKEYFDIHATYQSKVYNSGNEQSLTIDIKPN